MCASVAAKEGSPRRATESHGDVAEKMREKRKEIEEERPRIFVD
jgi:hypothetical protein